MMCPKTSQIITSQQTSKQQKINNKNNNNKIETTNKYPIYYLNTL